MVAPDGLLEAVPLDEPHGVIRAPVGIGAQAVDRDDARVLEPAGDLRLEQEPLTAGGIVGVRIEDLLERHLAVELAVEGHEHCSQAAAGVGPQHTEPSALTGGGGNGVGARAVNVAVVSRAVPGGHMAECRRDVWVAQPGQAFASRFAGR